MIPDFDEGKAVCRCNSGRFDAQRPGRRSGSRGKCLGAHRPSIEDVSVGSAVEPPQFIRISDRAALMASKIQYALSPYLSPNPVYALL